MHAPQTPAAKVRFSFFLGGGGPGQDPHSTPLSTIMWARMIGLLDLLIQQVAAHPLLHHLPHDFPTCETFVSADWCPSDEDIGFSFFSSCTALPTGWRRSRTPFPSRIPETRRRVGDACVELAVSPFLPLNLTSDFLHFLHNPCTGQKQWSPLAWKMFKRQTTTLSVQCSAG